MTDGERAVLFLMALGFLVVLLIAAVHLDARLTRIERAPYTTTTVVP